MIDKLSWVVAYPELLLLDEPLGALDKKLREATQIELVNIIEKVGVTCVMVTHDQEEAMTMASRIAVMSEGSLLQVGTPTEVYETPRTEFVADFIGNVNLFKNGQIVVALIDGEATLKRFFADGTCIRFIPENKHLLPIVVRAGEADTMIVGRLLKTIRSFE